MDISAVLRHFSSEELADALFAARLPVAGTKSERIARLLEASRQRGIDAPKLLDLFTSEALRAAVDSAGLKCGRRSEMVQALLSLSGPEANVGPTSAPTVALAYLEPTKDNVIACLRELRLPNRALRSEADVEEVVASYLAPRFQSVCQQYSIGGMLGLKVDLDIGDGRVGVELKLADSILGKTNEFHRLIGQAVYYDYRRYHGNLILCIAGRRGDDEDPLMRDLFSLLEAYRVASVCVMSA